MHPLDNVIWSALSTQHAGLAEGGALARRYPPAFAPFAAVSEMTASAFDALAALIPAGGQQVLFTIDEVQPTAALRVVQRGSVDQMVGPAQGAPRGAVAPLTAADAADMERLVTLTNPGPWRARTHELGRFFGVRIGGELVAMTGERMHLDGFTEVTAVCVHPEHRGKGYAADLIQTVSQGIVARGETPMLHVFSSNSSAIALYLKLGFVRRTTVRLAIVQGC